MNDRIRRLRQASLDAKPSLSLERAELLTRFYGEEQARDRSTPVERALAFRYLLEHKTIWIGEGELIVGERGPAPKATPTYPEICQHSLEDLEILHSRPKIPFAVSADDRALARDRLVPFWQGRTLRERIFREMEPAWHAAFEAGVFTEFMEQRAPGHTVLGDKLYAMGVAGLKAHIGRRLEELDPAHDPGASAKRQELEAMEIAADAIIHFAHRHALEAARRASVESDEIRRREWLEIAERCDRVPEHAPRTFAEALQAYWFIHLGVITELNTWDSFNPGRLDQHLYPFYRDDLAAGRLTKDGARELLQAFWVKFNNQPAPPKVGVTAEESATYTDFCLINLGGVRPDGSDGVNELTYLILDVIEEMRLLQPSSMAQISKKNPDRYVRRALKIIRTGFGQPSLFNTEALIDEMLRTGKSIEDARRGGASGCVETGAFGTEAYILTGYFNLVKVLELALHRGRDPRTGAQIGPETPDPRGWVSFENVFEAFEQQLRALVEIKIRGNQVIDRLYAEVLPVPFLSLLVDDCIEKGLDYHAGGARYNTSYIQGVGIGSITDALSAINYHVFETRRISMEVLLSVLASDFEGRESLRLELFNDTPRYGNDDDRPDGIMSRVFEAYYRAVDGRPNARGGRYGINMLPTTCHVYFGSVVGATPDGRFAGEPLSEGISPVQGADRLGPTAVIRSAAKMDHLRTGGTLLNQKFTPSLLDDEEGLDKVLRLVRTYFKLDGHHIQFNVVTADTLREAQRHPERYADLIVRVAGYSDYFVDLSIALQEEIIRRTEQTVF